MPTAPLRAALAVVLLAAQPGGVLAQSQVQAQGNRPISAIDWLDRGSDFAALPRPAPELNTPLQPPRPPLGDLAEPPVAERIITPEVTTHALNAQQAGAVGLLPRRVTGLPADLWQGSLPATLTRRIDALDLTDTPALQSLLYSLLLAETLPPEAPGSNQTANRTAGHDFLLARIDKLTAMGAVDPALALAERADPTSHPAIFARWFDLSLLAGDDHRACSALRDRPALSPSDAALTFCRAMLGQYDLAVLTFGTAAALGVLTQSEETLLRLYLDPELAEETPPLPPPARPSPLAFRLAEAIGTPLPTGGLPRAYAMTDLRGTSGWRAEIEAAERLTQSGALTENRLLGIYTAREPAASGEPWDRVEAIQQLDAAISASDRDRAARALPAAWSALQAAALDVPFARLWAVTLVDMDLGAATGDDIDADRIENILFDMAMLSPEYETLAARLPRPDARRKFLAALAVGEPGTATAPDVTAQAIQRGFAPETELPTLIRLDLQQGKLGEAMLQSMALLAQGAEGATKDIAPALAALRRMGLEDTSRRAALQLMLLERGL
ncbi:hypothetical protein [Pseudooceanicola nitratireducens]|uniref:hypothetical protein n=1 Tax=Pseudooceanicola nitratireducens TaxID=517719 RepID=UPI001C9851B6|nr:hypothetical protein [Pseudooceanicola nitratireducens]MBY6158842.1 hypothetical protein [Pseudooceanicola nitratireducens]